MQNTPKEWNFIQRIRQRVERPNSHTIIGLGDDAFVFKNFPGYSVLCQDMLVEGTHFDRAYFSASDLGWKALAVNLSDMAAMGATPHFAQVSLALPKNLNESWLDQFYEGMCALADKTSCEIAGGDLTRTDHNIVIDVSVHGSCDFAFSRKGAKAHDLLLSSGPLGLSHVGLWALRQHKAGYDTGKNRHLRPQPRTDLVPFLQSHRNYIHAAMDCSDGLVNDGMLMAGSLGLVLEESALHDANDVMKMAAEAQVNPSDIVLWGGEDYELLLAIPSEHKHLFNQWKVVGHFTEKPGIFLSGPQGFQEITKFKGWTHF